MSNSKMVDYVKISPNRTIGRTHKIDTITIHCMAGNITVQTCGNIFASSSRGASSNYGIDSDGKVGMYVPEKDRSWCSSNRDNDMRAVTIEVANTAGADKGWPVSDKAYSTLILLVADICKRNGITKLKWKADKSLIGQVDKQNMTVHRWFKNKDCPGKYLYDHMGDIANQVNKILGSSSTESDKSTDVVNEYTKKDFIKDIQNVIGVTVDGIAGTNTINNTPTLSAKRNKKHKAVKYVQKYLKHKGYTEIGAVDGIAGPKFTEAVKHYQSDHNCVSDGIISAKGKTWKSLLSVRS